MGRKDRKARKIARRQKKLQQKRLKLQEAGKFKRWRNERPFWGATLTLLAGLLILYIPMQLYAIAFLPGSFAFIGFLFGGLVVMLGIFAYIYPQWSTIFGVMTLFLSVLSIMGALGGFFVGTIIGICGGSLLIAWQPEKPGHEDGQRGRKKDSGHPLQRSVSTRILNLDADGDYNERQA